MVKFEDGSSVGPFDMVVGCDGIKSAVKEYVETGKISPGASKQDGKSAVYSGIRIRYAVDDGDPSYTADAPELRQYFGEGAYALAGVYGAGANRPPRRAAFITFLDKNYIGPFRKADSASPEAVRENADWTQDVRSPASTRELMLEQTKDCRIPDIDIGPTIESADRFFELGVYFHNPFSLSGWSREVPGSEGRFCTLSGDAAHAMPPFLGTSQADGLLHSHALLSYAHSEISAAQNKHRARIKPSNPRRVLFSKENLRAQCSVVRNIRKSTVGRGRDARGSYSQEAAKGIRATAVGDNYEY